MTKTDITNWHNDYWWPAYKLFINTPFKTVFDEDPEYGPGGRGESLRKMLTLNPSEELRNKLLKKIKEQTNHRQTLGERLKSKQAYELYTAPLAKKVGLSIYKNRQSRTYIFNFGWEDEIPRIKTITAKPPGKKCECGNPVHGPRFDKCTTCLFPPLELVK